MIRSVSEKLRKWDAYPKTLEDFQVKTFSGGADGVLHEASTYDVDGRVHEYARDLQDTSLLAKLAGSDMITLEAKYHAKCLAHFYNRHRRSEAASSEEESADHPLYGIAFAELVSYMGDAREDDIAPVFKLADLAKLYQFRLAQLGVVDTADRTHSTRLKNRLLDALPDLSEHTEGRDILLTFNKDIGGALRKACNYDTESVHLAKAAQFVRRDIFNKAYSFNGSFQKSQEEAVPSSLLALGPYARNFLDPLHRGAVSKNQQRTTQRVEL
ncbi:hypothetical protein GWK47_021370 [Chionoecetes opilio]|uniref:Uncharacterized protein n=1 Tax=Chionoecetes opilio TaxID=41210 RepID=A0A8J4XXM6_CHIOP|nr:hypothetical protein GWK47_021370 [Chionoecetes opilio]